MSLSDWHDGVAAGAARVLDSTLSAIERTYLPEPARREIVCAAVFRALLAQDGWLMADLPTEELSDFVGSEYDRTGGAL